MRLELQFQRALQAEFVFQVIAPPLVDVLHQRTADARRVFLRVGALQPDEGGVGVAVDHRIALGLNQLPRAAHDLVAAQGD
ncbi:hypothetical protein D3C76_915120 [compost metagenome]